MRPSVQGMTRLPDCEKAPAGRLPTVAYAVLDGLAPTIAVKTQGHQKERNSRNLWRCGSGIVVV